MKVSWLSCILLIFPQIDGSEGKTKLGLKVPTSERPSEVSHEKPSYNSSVRPSEGHVKLQSAPFSAKPSGASSEKEIWKQWLDPGLWNLLGQESTDEEPGIEGRVANCFVPWRLGNVCSCTGGDYSDI